MATLARRVMRVHTCLNAIRALFLADAWLRCLTPRIERRSHSFHSKHRAMGAVRGAGWISHWLIAHDLAAGIHERQRTGRHGARHARDALLLGVGKSHFCLRARKI